MMTYYGKIVVDCDDVLEYSKRFRRAIEMGNTREASESSALAARNLDHIAVSVRRLQEGALVTGDDVAALGQIDIGRLYGNVSAASWGEAKETSKVPSTCAWKPLRLKDALDKRIHALVGSYRLEPDAHVLLSHGATSARRDGGGGVPWIAEWEVARFIEATRGMLVIAEERAPVPSEPRRAA